MGMFRKKGSRTLSARYSLPCCDPRSCAVSSVRDGDAGRKRSSQLGAGGGGAAAFAISSVP